MQQYPQDTTSMQDVNVQQEPPAYGQPEYGQQQVPYGQQQAGYGQQPAYIGGPSASPAPPTQTSSVASGCNGASFKRVLTSPDGILRCVEWLFAVISFGAMADQSGYDQFSEFQFLVAAGVLTWLWTMAMLSCYIFDLAGSNPILNLVEFAGDCLWALFEFVAGIVAAKKCNDYSCSVGKIQAAAAFAFLCFFALLGSAFFSYKKWRMNK